MPGGLRPNIACLHAAAYACLACSNSSKQRRFSLASSNSQVMSPVGQGTECVLAARFCLSTSLVGFTRVISFLSILSMLYVFSSASLATGYTGKLHSMQAPFGCRQRHIPPIRKPGTVTSMQQAKAAQNTCILWINCKPTVWQEKSVLTLAAQGFHHGHHIVLA